MNFIQTKLALCEFKIFSLHDVCKINPQFHRRRLYEWQQKGYIKKIIKGYYIFSDLDLNDTVLFEVANKIYKPSYISFEMALSFYGLIPEGVYTVTSTTTSKTKQFDTPIGFFSYRTLKPSLFFGYDLISDQHQNVKMASLEKALLDYLYINPWLKSEADFLELRINSDMLFEQLNNERLKLFEKRFAQKSLSRRLKTFFEVMKYD